MTSQEFGHGTRSFIIAPSARDLRKDGGTSFRHVPALAEETGLWHMIEVVHYTRVHILILRFSLP